MISSVIVVSVVALAFTLLLPKLPINFRIKKQAFFLILALFTTLLIYENTQNPMIDPMSFKESYSSY